MKTILYFTVILISILVQNHSLAAATKNRVVILTDIEADPDDTESLIRLMLYSNLIDLKGIIATTSVHQKNRIAPESIRKVIEAYGKVRDNLEKHESGYPVMETLMALVKEGPIAYGMQGVGEGKDSPGSDWIMKVLEEKDDRPLWISVWGGSNTLAQALYKIRKTKTEAEVRKLISKLRVYAISDQDDSGIWIRKNFPDLFYIVSPGGYFHATWIGFNSYIPGINNETLSTLWLSRNIQQGHGPLGAAYPDVAYGMEGDTPSWLSLIPNGLNEPEHPDWGGWGGRYEYYLPAFVPLGTTDFNGGVPVEPETHPIWTNANDAYTPYIYNAYGRAVKKDSVSFHDNKVTIWRWRDDLQNDFAARMQWCTKSFQEANHPPVPALAHPDQITVKSGELFSLDATGSADPDGDNLSYLWFHYPEAGTYKKTISCVAAENLQRVTILAPQVEKPETAHFILKVTDKGEPALSRYKRVVVTIIPR